MKRFADRLSLLFCAFAMALFIMLALCYPKEALADEEVYYDGESDQFAVTVTWEVENGHSDEGNYIKVCYYQPFNGSYFADSFVYYEIGHRSAETEGMRSKTFYLPGPPSQITMSVYGSATDHTQYYIKKVEVEPLKQRDIPDLPEKFTLWEGKFGCSVATMFTNTIACDLYLTDGKPSFSNWYDPSSYREAVFGDNKFNETYDYFETGCSAPRIVYDDSEGVSCDGYGVAWPLYEPSHHGTNKETAALLVTQESTVYGTALADPAYEVHDGAQTTISYKGTMFSGEEYESPAKPTQAGAYAVFVTEETADTIYAGSAAFTIRKADPTVTAPTARTLTCNGQEQELVEAGEASGGTMLYALGEEGSAPQTGWDEKIPTGIDAQTYHVWYMVAGDANHNNSEPASVAVTIAEPAKVTYSCTGGAGTTWTKGSTDGLTMTFKRSDGTAEDTTFTHFKSVSVDGKDLKDSDFTAVKGSVVITVQPAYLKGLSAGKHTLEATFDDGAATADFTVAEAASDTDANTSKAKSATLPKTGDPTSVTALVYLTVSGAALALAGMRRRR